MNEQLRNKICRELAECLFDYFHDRNTVRDIVNYGLDFKGLSNMTDQELLDDYREYVLCGTDDDELAKEAEASLAIDEMLSE